MNNSLMNTYAPLSPVITKGEGVYLYDIKDTKYLDLTSGIGVNSLGYGHKEWSKAIANQSSTMQHCSNIFLNPTTIDLSNKLTKISDMSKVFFSNSGAEANEGAIKLARKYSFEKYGPNRNKIITLKESFHGRTMLTLKATGQPKKFHNYFFPFPEGFDYLEANNINNIERILTDDVCAIMMEAIQGEGGVHPLNNDFVEKVVSYCSKKDIIIIFDEIQCGIARTGKLFGFQNFNVKPDIITLAKGLGAGLPIGAILCNDKLSSVLKPGDHGSTFGGNPVSCAGAIVVLNELCNEKTYKESYEKGELIKTLFKEASPSQVTDVRGLGLMVGIEVKGSSSEIQAKALEKGVLVLTAGPNIVRLLPPIIISKEELTTGIKVLIELLQ